MCEAVGIPGVQAADGSVCRPSSCGDQCGGTWCEHAGADGSCCIGGRNGILATSEHCVTTGAAPCVIFDRGKPRKQKTHVLPPVYGTCSAAGNPFGSHDSRTGGGLDRKYRFPSLVWIAICDDGRHATCRPDPFRILLGKL